MSFFLPSATDRAARVSPCDVIAGQVTYTVIPEHPNPWEKTHDRRCCLAAPPARLPYRLCRFTRERGRIGPSRYSRYVWLHARRQRLSGDRRALRGDRPVGRV